MITIQELHTLFLKSTGVTTDTRNCPPESIFFALKGDNFNGNDYAQLALDSGCSYAIVDELRGVKSERVILVDNCLETLQQLAKYHRLHLQTPIIAITGTNGKTTTKELLNTVIGSKYKCLATKGNLNNHIGVPLTLLQLTQDHQYGIIEMGANHIGEIELLCEIAQPNFGLITNVGKAHLEGFGSFEGVKTAKGELYRFIEKHNGLLFINIDNVHLMGMKQNANAFYYSNESTKGFVHCSSYEVNPYLELKFKIGTDTNEYSLKSNIIGSYNLENILAAITIGTYIKIDTDTIVDSIEKYIPSNNRSQLSKSSKNTILIDCYNANPSSMDVAIKNFIEIKNQNKTLILGEMRELGENSIMEHVNLISLIKSSGITSVFLVGNEFLKTDYSFDTIKHFSTSEELLKQLTENPLENRLILLKGSRGNRLELLINAL